MDRGLLGTGPAEQRHDLMLGGTRLDGSLRTELTEAMR